MTCWYCKKKRHKKLDCRKRKANLKKREGKGRGNGYEHAHVARTQVAAEALVDSGASFHILNGPSLLSDKRKDNFTTVKTRAHECVRPNCVGKRYVGLGITSKTTVRRSS